LQDTPAAITAFTEDLIEDARIIRPIDFVNLTANVNLVETQNSGNAFIIIRGITQARNSESSVAVVVDGVQQVNPAQFNQELFDIEQIEVLKGPQGGLYGRNARSSSPPSSPPTSSRARLPQGSTTGSAILPAAASAGHWPRA
jgi:iron complex outermembrane receptor protein